LQKRLIGRKFNDKSLQEAIKRFPFKIIDKGGQPHVLIKLRGKEATYTPEEIMSMVLRRLKEVAEKHIGKPVHRAVVAVPAYFDDAQRAATREAGRIAGLDILLVINEPTAAALAYRLDETNQTEFQLHAFGLDKISYDRQVLVYDLGASTLDVSIITIEEGVFDVQATAGDTHRGAEDFNNRVISFVAKKYNEDNNVDVTKDTRAMEKLRREVEKAKRTLSSQEATVIAIKSFYNGDDFSETLTRAQFEALNNDLFDETLKYVKRALKDARMNKSDIDDIVLVGGGSRIPMIEQMLENFFGKKIRRNINPEEVIAIGAAVQSSFFANGIEADRGCFMGPTTLISLGLEATDGTMVHLIKRGTNIPIKKSQVFSTTVDNQSVFPIKIFEGERSKTKDNHKLAEFQPNIIPQVTDITDL
jgi:heat shock protein 5